MPSGDFNILYKRPRILVAPLGWGLGHATRCIPIIKELLLLNCVPVIAGDVAVVSLLKKEFPELEFLPLIDYNISYSKNKFWMPIKMLLQFPRVLRSISAEHTWLKQAVQKHNIDAVISDNRFGLYYSTIPTVYITHQLLIKTGNRFSEKIAQKIHYHFIKKYTKCWVPDFAEKNNLAGKLSHPTSIPANVEYIGCLSRFEKQSITEKKYDLLIIISGPEPQRTIFEKLLLQQLKNYQGVVLFVRGLPESMNEIPPFNKVTIVNHLPAAELETAIQQADIIISRSGYTTIMDLVKLQKKAILIPTPGQTEQEYLAKYLAEKKAFYCIEQDEFILKDALKIMESFSSINIANNMLQYKKQSKPL